jgi:hypothetical protein
MKRWIAPVVATCIVALAGAIPFASASRLTVTSKQVTDFRLTTRPSVPNVLRLVATDDTWNDDRATNTAHGNDPRLGIADNSQACFVIAGSSCTTIRNARAYVRFDLSALPASATIQSATLTLRGGTGSSDSTPVEARRVTNSWTEAMTYYARPSTTGSGAVIGSATTVAGTVQLSLNMTSFVRNRGTTSIANGWELRPSGTDSWWYSSEWSDPALRPTLTVIYQ